MGDIAARINHVIATDLGLRLKAEGYRKNGRTFFRADVDHTCAVNVQGRKWNAGDEGSFAVNLGVYFPIVAELGGGVVARGAFPKENECSVSTRLGPGAADGADYWWSIAAGDDMARLAAAVGAAWNDVGRPWMALASTLRGAYGIYCERLLHFPAAIFALALGEREQATSHVWTAIDRLPPGPGLPRGRARLEEWGRRHGLVP